MLRTTLCAIALVGTVSLAAQTGPKSFEVIAKGTTKNTCVPVKSEDELLSQLTRVGWGGETYIPNIFSPPAGGTKAKVAVVVTTADRSSKITDISPSASELRAGTAELTVYLTRNPEKVHSGVFVVKLDPKYSSVKICTVQYISDKNLIAAASPPPPHDGGSFTLNSAPTDDVVVNRVSSEDAQQHLLKHPDAQYPKDLAARHLQGPVKLRIEIGEDGNVTYAQRISGSPELAPAAIDAVKQWKYKPFLVDGEPVKAITDVQVNFKDEDDEDDDD